LTFQGTRIDSEEFKRKFDAMYPQSAASFDHSPFRQKADKAQSKLRYLEEDTQFDSEGRETEIDEILNAIFVPAFQQGAQDVKLRYDFSKKAVSIEYIIDDVQVFPPSYPASRQLFSMLMNRLMLRARIDDPVSLNVRRGEIVFQFNDSQGRRQMFTGRVLIMPRANPDAPLEERNRDFYATVRLLRVSGERLTINQLGLYPHELEAFKFARRQKSGLILICGQTGSGKNITITANLEQYVLENGGSVRGISLERPIEGTIHGFDQIAVTGDLVKIGGVEVLRDGPYYLSGAMQASPRVLYINEINDAQTARLAIIAEQTGNLIWSTVHAKNPFAVIDRLRGLEVSSDFVAGSLLMIVHQVLSRKICEMCKVPDLDWRKRILNCEQAPNLVYFPEAIRHWCSTESNPNPSDADVDRIFRPYRGSGLLPNGHSCPNCQRKTADGIVSTGVTGRTLIPEIWLTGSQQSQIIEGVPSTTLRRTAIRRGHNTLWFNALRRIIDGIISIDSAAEACEAIDLYKEGIGDFDPHDDRVAGPNTHNSPRIVRVTVQSTGNPGTPARQLPQ
jgi:type II secretory ATPase GspE/PulE/Tfp pilus assembly ATPase PilB-like protein